MWKALDSGFSKFDSTPGGGGDSGISFMLTSFGLQLRVMTETDAAGTANTILSMMSIAEM